MRIFKTLAVLTMSTAVGSLAHAQSMGKPQPADTQHMMRSDSTAKKQGSMRSRASNAKQDQMGKKPMASDSAAISAMDGQNHGPGTRKPHSSPAARDTGMAKPHPASRDSSSMMRKPFVT